MRPAIALLPVIERELRVSSRRWGTYWTRFGAGLAVTFFISAFLVVMYRWNAIGVSMATGGVLYQIFQTGGFCLALSGGVLLATDSLAEERREGTLGLLLLTSLNGWDIAVGKLFVALLRSGQWLLAIVPPAMVTLLFGGVRGSEVMALALVLANTLFWSNSVALLASSLCERWTRALLWTLVLLAMGIIAPILLDSWFGFEFWRSSPWSSLDRSRSPASADFWINTGIIHLEGWTCIALVGWRIRRSATSTAITSPARRRFLTGFLKTTPRQNARRQASLDKSPTAWLASRDRSLVRVLNGFALVIVGILVYILLGPLPLRAINASGIAGGLLGVLVHIVLVAQASRFFSDAARNGMLELLVATPLSARELVKGPLLVLARALLFPATLVLLLQVVQILSVVASIQGISYSGPGIQLQPLAQMQFVGLTFTVVSYPLSLAALAWFSLFMGLLCRNPGKAFALSLALGWIAPGFVATFLGAALIPWVVNATAPGWVVAVILGLAGIALHLFLLLYSRRCLRRQFHELATGEFRALTRRAKFSSLPPKLVGV